MSQPLKKVTLNTAADRAGKVSRYIHYDSNIIYGAYCYSFELKFQAKVEFNDQLQADRQGIKRRREPENTADNVDVDDSKIGDTVLPSNMVAK
jgi:hypothetical protein